ncbi:hypothetical protein N0V86_000098 [Didymella sp. IMI 355093]|nr:hypothetical protein N0V86_000098 [Didymella sp. IMI 355093]
MRMVPASVVVVTVAHVDPETDRNMPMGIAVSSFSTVTLDPPTVSFNIKQPSKTLSAIRDARGSFRVHFLASHHEGLQIIEHFCRGNHPDAYEERLKDLHVKFPQAEDGLETTAPLAPRIMGSGVCAEFECTLTHELPVADHVILVAQITSAVARNVRAPTMAYVNGSYRRLDNEGLIQRHESEQPPKQPAAGEQHEASKSVYDLSKSSLSFDIQQELAISFDWPGIPGEQERSEFAERLRSYLKGLQGLRFANQADVKKQLSLSLEEVAGQLGIDVVALIQECQKGSSVAQVLPEFYWRLSPSKMAMLVDRMEQLVKADKRFLEVPYQELLHYLDVNVGTTDVLPSDLLEPLRAQGLVPPFRPSASLLPTDMIDGNILIMEQVEHALAKKARSWLRDSGSRPTLREMAREAGIPSGVMFHFARTRVCNVESDAPEDASIDITGDVCPEEGLVVIRRIAEHMILNSDTRRVHFKNQKRREAVILRNIKVDPRITGVNSSYVVTKIRSLTSNGVPIKRQVEEWLEPYFAHTVKWDDLNTRIAAFVQKLPLRATSWGSKDILAAMGLSESTLIVTPDNATSKTIAESKVLNMLLAKALKNHYGKGSAEENKAIAVFLQDRYGFDVTAARNQ